MRSRNYPVRYTYGYALAERHRAVRISECARSTVVHGSETVEYNSDTRKPMGSERPHTEASEVQDAAALLLAKVVNLWRDNPDERRATIKLRMSRQK
ncbi:protein of unknown function (plasmid) [Caballeronia sp. S22]